MSVCATIGKLQAESIAESNDRNKEIENFSLDDNGHLLSDEKVWIFDLPDEEGTQDGKNHLLEDFPSRDGELVEEFPKRYEEDDDISVGSFRSVGSIWSAISNISFGSKRSGKSGRNISKPYSARRRKSRRSSRTTGLVEENFENGEELTDDSNNKEFDNITNDNTAIESLISDQAEFFENDPVGTLMSRTYGARQRKSRRSSRTKGLLEPNFENGEEVTNDYNNKESDKLITESLIEDQTDFFENDPLDKLMLKLTSDWKEGNSKRMEVMPESCELSISSETICEKNPLDNLIEKLTISSEPTLADNLIPPSLLYDINGANEESLQLSSSKSILPFKNKENAFESRCFESLNGKYPNINQLNEISDQKLMSASVIHTTLKPTQLTQMVIRELLEETKNMPSIPERSERSGRSIRTDRSVHTDRSTQTTNLSNS